MPQSWSKVKNLLRIPLIRSVPGLACVFIGRGPERRPDPAHLASLLEEPGSSVSRSMPVTTLRQIHSNRCLVVETRSGGEAGEADALLTTLPGVAMGIAAADCLPIIAVDPVARALAVVHAGWRGTLSGVLPAALGRMTADLKARPERIVVGVGPAIGACCYRVGEEVAEGFRDRHPRHAAQIVTRGPDGIYLDLMVANRLQALDAGVTSERFASAGICTACRVDAWHSYRKEGPGTGRQWLLAAMITSS